MFQTSFHWLLYSFSLFLSLCLKFIDSWLWDKIFKIHVYRHLFPRYWKKIFLKHLVLVALGLPCWVWAFCMWSQPGLLSSCGAPASHCSGFSCGARAPGAGASAVAAHGLSSCDSRARERGSVVVLHQLSCPMACGSSWTRGKTHVPCTGRQILHHWDSREASKVLKFF